MAETDRRIGASRVALAATLAVGVVLRVQQAATSPAMPDAGGYVDLARQMRWLNPWEASYREPLWVLLVKVTTAPFGYSVGAVQVVSLIAAVAGLGVAAWALRQIAPRRPWLVVAGMVPVALSSQLVSDASSGTRDALGTVVLVVAIGALPRRPHWLPILAVVALGVRWELGMMLMAVSAVLAVASVVPRRALAGGALLAAVAVGPFVAANAVEYGDPMLHSNVHATFNANMERWGWDPPIDVVPADERLHPQLWAPNFSSPLVSWSGYVRQVGAGEVLEREAAAVAELPVSAATFGRVPWAVGVALLAVAGTVLVRRDRFLVLPLMAGWLVAGYGLIFPWLDRRLIGSLVVVLVAAAVAGVDGWLFRSAVDLHVGDSGEAVGAVDARPHVERAGR